MQFFGRKKHIKILADKFNHSIEFSSSSLIIKSNINFIELTETQKNKVNIRYNVTGGEVKLSVTEIDLIDVVFEILRREKLEPVEMKEGELMSLKNYIDEVGKHYVQEKIKKIKFSRTDGTYKNEILNGNRMEAEVYDNLLILTDDLRVCKTNTIDINEITV